MRFRDTMRAGIEELFPKIPMRRSGEGTGAPDARRLQARAEAVGLVLLALLAVGYACFVGSMLSRAYIDLGDGNYLYTSSRMADGLTIYRDCLSPQPPLHLLIGSMLVRLGRLFGGQDAALYAIRIFSIILHILTMGWIYLLGRRLTQTPYGGALAACVFLVLPTGFWWSLGYQSELLEIFWMMTGLWFFLNLRPAPMAVAGAAMALSVLTNMTAAPYAAAAIAYLVVRHGVFKETRDWRLALYFAVPFVVILGGVSLVYEMRTGAYFQNVILNQIGSYPRGDAFWPYVWRKLADQTPKILMHEGVFIVLSLLGLALYNRTDTRPEREFLVWYALALLLSFIYVTKGGTADYIFTIGEPAVALFCAYFLVQFFYSSTWRRFFRQSLWRDTTFWPQLAILLLLAGAATIIPVRFLGAVHRQEQFEQNEEGLERVEYYIRTHSKPREPIVSAPYYAFITNRLLVEEYSELFLWSLKYSLEVDDMLLKSEDLTAPLGLARKIARRQGPLASHLADLMPGTLRGRLAAEVGGDALSDGVARDLLEQLNRILRGGSLGAGENVQGLALPPEAEVLMGRSPIGADLARLNRMVLDAAYPEAVRRGTAAYEPDGEGIAKVKAIAGQLRKRDVPVVVANVSDANYQLLRSPEVRQAVGRFYKPLVPEADAKYFKTLSFQIQVFIPKTDQELAETPE